MSLPVFFELRRAKDLPTYVNANHVSSIDFLGDAKDGYVACLAVNTIHYLWGDLHALETVLETKSFGTHLTLVSIVSDTPVSRKRLFDNMVTKTTV